MSDDHISELQLIDHSSAQRETLFRWMLVCADAGEAEIAEEIRQEIKVADKIEFVMRAA